MTDILFETWLKNQNFLDDLKIDLDYSRRAMEIQKRLVQGSNPFGTSTLTTSPRPNRTTRKPKWKKKKKKKKKPRQHKSKTTTTTATTAIPPTVMGLATTETPWAATPLPRWRLVAEKLFSPPWDQGVLNSNIAKVCWNFHWVLKIFQSNTKFKCWLWWVQLCWKRENFII